MRRSGRVGRGVAWVLACALFCLVASPSGATPATLKRSIENLTQWPLDAALAPVTSGVSVYRNMQTIDDSTAVRVFYPLPGYVWNVIVIWGASALRGVAGVLELGPGVVLLFTDADLSPIFDIPGKNPGLVNFETGIYDFNFAIDYTTPTF
jgi:hypothetical protein